MKLIFMIPCNTEKNKFLNQHNQNIRAFMHRFYCILYDICHVIKIYTEICKLKDKKNNITSDYNKIVKAITNCKNETLTVFINYFKN